jgi:hypothetical protein
VAAPSPDPSSSPAQPHDADPPLGTVHEKLEGWIPPLASDDEIHAALEKALDYRGDVTITKKDGTVIEGYIFDRRLGPTLAASAVRLFPKDQTQKLAISYADIAALAFTGRDTAAGRSWETWLRKWAQRKAAGEKNICLEPEHLD